MYLQQLKKLRDEYDSIVDEYDQARVRMREFQIQIENLRAECEALSARSQKSVHVAEKELEIVKEEVRVLREANERLVKKFVIHDFIRNREFFQQKSLTPFTENKDKVMHISSLLFHIITKSP